MVVQGFRVYEISAKLAECGKELLGMSDACKGHGTHVGPVHAGLKRAEFCPDVRQVGREVWAGRIKRLLCRGVANRQQNICTGEARCNRFAQRTCRQALSVAKSLCCIDNNN